MRKYLKSVLSILTLLIIVLSGCRKEFSFSASEGNLEFSRDTVFLDTIFSNISSNTHILKVYNTTRNDIEIPSIRLAQGVQSAYRLNVDGVSGKVFKDIPLYSQDSLFIFIETTVDATNKNDFLYTDILQFDEGDKLQEIPLVTLVKDATFLFPTTLADGSKETITLGTDASGNPIKVAGFSLKDEELRFTNEKPYVIYGYAEVPPEKVLTIDAGARIHFHTDSGIAIRANAEIQCNGALSEDQDLLEQEIIFEGDRLSSEFDKVSGQWGSIWIAPGSTNNRINFTTIKNATIGLNVQGTNNTQTPTLQIENTKIYNSLSSNIWARSATIVANNLVLGNTGGTSLYLNEGGSYKFTHCTIANYWSTSFRNGLAVTIDNFNDTSTFPLRQADFTNCIIDGNSAIELNLNTKAGSVFNYSLTNCLLKFRDDNNIFAGNPLYDFGRNDFYNTIFLNENAYFLNTADNNFNIEELSAVRDNANNTGAQNVPFDILGKIRTTSPDIGAYEFQE